MLAVVITLALAGLVGIVLYLAHKRGRTAAEVDALIEQLEARQKDAQAVKKAHAEVDNADGPAIRERLLSEWRRKE